MQQTFTRGLYAAVFLLALIVLVIASPAVRAETEGLFTVVVDLNSSPPRALNAVTGQPMSTNDVQVVNPQDNDRYELQPQNMQGQHVDLWVVEQHIAQDGTHWAATNITETKVYEPWAGAKLRAWVQTNREVACATAERLDPEFQCYEEIPEEDLYRLADDLLRFYYSSVNPDPEQILTLGQRVNEFPSVIARTEWTPNWAAAMCGCWVVEMPMNAVQIMIPGDLPLQVAQDMMNAGWLTEGRWFWKAGYKPAELEPVTTFFVFMPAVQR